MHTRIYVETKQCVHAIDYHPNNVASLTTVKKHSRTTYTALPESSYLSLFDRGKKRSRKQLNKVYTTITALWLGQ